MRTGRLRAMSHLSSTQLAASVSKAAVGVATYTLLTDVLLADVSYNAIPRNTVYTGPRVSSVNACACNSVVYNLVSACGACQGRNWTRAINWFSNCPGGAYYPVYDLTPSTLQVVCSNRLSSAFRRAEFPLAWTSHDGRTWTWIKW